MLNMFKGDILHSGIGGFAAKQIAAGLLKRFAKTWTIEGFKEAQTGGLSGMDFFGMGNRKERTYGSKILT